MGPVNWLGVLCATLAALVVSSVWYGPIHGRARIEELGPGGLGTRISPFRTLLISAVLLFVSASMMGHMFARVGSATLAIKPWLYFMMSGGLAGAFVVPALWVSHSHQRVSSRLAWIDAGHWLLVYLTMGLTFYLFKA